MEQQPTALAALSNDLANAVEQSGQSIVAVNARRRFPATGIAWTADGLVLTADHVVERDEDITIGLPSGPEVPATVVARDPGTDIALLRAQQPLTAAARSAEAPRVGNIVLAVARPGNGPLASIGIVSALTGNVRTSRGGTLESIIYTDATFFPGFSGGPLVSASGQVIGLNTSHLGRGAPVAIPVSVVDRVVAALLSHGRVKRGYLGVTSQPVEVPPAARSSVGGQERGVLVIGIQAGAPADQSGLMVGDILISFNDQKLSDTEDLQRALLGDLVGKAVAVRVLRGGQPATINVTVGERSA